MKREFNTTPNQDIVGLVENLRTGEYSRLTADSFPAYSQPKSSREDAEELREAVDTAEAPPPREAAEKPAWVGLSLETPFIGRERELAEWIVNPVRIAPVLIALDDLHWAGEALLNTFSALTIDTKRLPLLLVGIFRTFETQSEDTIASALVSIARTGQLRKIGLENLSAEETIQLILKRTGGSSGKLQEKDIERIGAFSCGIPLFAVELSNFVREGHLDFLHSPILLDQPDFSATAERKIVPSLMLRIAHLRLNQLEEDYVDLVKAASLILGAFSFNLARQITLKEPEALEDILVDLEHRNLLHHIERGDSLAFEFNHQLIKLAISETITALERRRYFKRIIDAIEAAGEECSSNARAYYLYNAGEKRAALPHLLSSAQMWLGYGDKAAGMKYSKIAYQIAIDRFQDAPEDMIEAILTHGENLLHQGHLRAAVDVYNEALDKLGSKGSNQIRFDLTARRDRLKDLLQVEPNGSSNDFAPLAIVTTKRALANVRISTGRPDEAQRLIEEADALLIKLSDNAPAQREEGLLLQVKAKFDMDNGDYPAALKLLDKSLELLAEHSIASELAETYCLQAKIFRLQRNFKKAEVALGRCEEQLAGFNDPARQAEYHHELGMLALRRQRYEEAERELNKALELTGGSSVQMLGAPQLLIDYARVQLALGRKDRAGQFAEGSFRVAGRGDYYPSADYSCAVT